MYVVGTDQPVVGQIEFAVVHITDGHLRQVDAGRLYYQHRCRDVRFESGIEGNFVAVLDGDFAHAPFNRNQVVVKEERLIKRDPRLDDQPATDFLVVGGFGAEFVAARRDTLEERFAHAVGEEFARYRGNVFVLQCDAGVGQTGDELTVFADCRGVDVGGFEEDVTLPALGQADINIEGLAGEVVADHFEFELVDAFRGAAGRREGEVNATALADGECAVGLTGNAGPGRNAGAVGLGQRELQVHGVLQTVVLDDDRLDLATALGEAGFDEAWRAGQVGFGFRQGVVDPHLAERGSGVFVADHVEDDGARGLGVVVGTEDDGDVERLPFDEADRIGQLQVNAGRQLACGLAGGIEDQTQVGRCGPRAGLGGEGDGERVVLRDVEFVGCRTDGDAVDGEGLLFGAVGDVRVDGTDFVEPGIGEGRLEGVDEVAATIGENAEGAFEALLVENKLQAAVGQRGFADPVESPATDHDVLVTEGTDRIDVGDFTNIRSVDERDGFFGTATGNQDFVVLAAVVAQFVNFKLDPDTVRASAGHVEVKGIGDIVGTGRDAGNGEAVGQGHDVGAKDLFVGLAGQDVAVGVENPEAQFARVAGAVVGGSEEFNVDVAGVLDGEFEFTGGTAGEFVGGHANNK